MEELNLGGNGVTDEAVNSALDVLIKNNNLKDLVLGSISDTACQRFSAILNSQQSALEKLDIGGRFSEDTFISLTSSLSNNTKLKELSIGSGFVTHPGRMCIEPHAADTSRARAW